MNRRLGITLALVAALGVATAALAMSGDGGGQEAPTEDQARAALQTKFDQARAGDPKVFCADTEIVAMCESQWDRLGGKAGLPNEEPRVASTRVQDGYRVLRVCGQDGKGQDYRTDFVVGLKDGNLTYALPVFWNGATFSGVHDDDSGRVDGTTNDAAGDCS